MPYSAGQIIRDDEYNVFVAGNADGTANHTVNNVNSIWGAGSGTKGYGQSGNLTTVAAGATITATQWANLLSRISTIASHQGTSVTTISLPTVGTVIEAYLALESNLAGINTNKLNASSIGSTSANTTQRTAIWHVSVAITQNVAFASTEAMQNFFNAGGYISLNQLLSGGSNNAKVNAWKTLLVNTGEIRFTSDAVTKVINGVSYLGTKKIGGSGSHTIGSNTGFHQLTTSDKSLFKQFASTAVYTSNSVEVRAKISGSTIIFTTIFVDDANASQDENVDGTLSSTLTVIRPSTSNLSDTWGTITLSGSQTGS